MAARRWREGVRWTVRLALLAAAALLALGGPAPGWAARLVPGFSPLAALGDALAQRAWYGPFAWLGPPVLVLVLGVWRGRWFCRWVCPAGTLVAAVSRVSRRRAVLRRPVAGTIFWAALGGAAVGAPLALMLDPLASFNRLPVLAAGAAGGAAWIPGLLVPLMLVAALWQPAVWCSHVCPLGYLQELVDHRRGPVPARWRRERRRFLAGMAVGAVAGLGWRRAARAARPPVLPPGALPADRFGAVCTRCYACVNACPSGVLRVGWPRGGRDLAAWFQPELDADAGACEEFCRACTQVCPSGAIRPLSEESKRRRQLGVARVTRSACLAWADGEYCMVCQEFCPYHAIESVPDARGVPRPVVNPSVCRGCGFCQHACPAVRAGKAVRVEGLAQQRELRE